MPLAIHGLAANGSCTDQPGPPVRDRRAPEHRLHPSRVGGLGAPIDRIRQVEGARDRRRWCLPSIPALRPAFWLLRALDQDPCVGLAVLCPLLPKPDLLAKPLPDQARHLLGQRVPDRRGHCPRAARSWPAGIGPAGAVHQPHGHAELALRLLDAPVTSVPTLSARAMLSRGMQSPRYGGHAVAGDDIQSPGPRRAGR